MEGDRGLVRPSRKKGLIIGLSPLASTVSMQPSDEKEAGEIAFVVFDPGLQNFAAIFAGGLAPGNSGRFFQSIVHDVLYTARGVVTRHRLDVPMPAEEIPTLIEGHGMRKNLPQRPQFRSRRSDHIVHDTQQVLGLDENVP